MMQRFAFLLLTLSTIQCSVASAAIAQSNIRSASKSNEEHAAVLSQHEYEQQQRRELTWWSSMLSALRCPPGRGKKCGHGSKSGSGGSSGGGSSGSSGSSSGGSSSGSSSGGSSGGSSGSSSTTSSSGGSDSDGSSSSGGGSSSTSSSSGGGDGSGSDDAVQASGYSFEADDGFAWESSNLDNAAGSGSIESGSSAKSIGTFIFVALAAGVAGAAFMVSRKNRDEEEHNHPLEGSLKKRMKLFTGGVFRKPRVGGSLNIPGDDGNGNTPAFIEIASVRTGLSSRGGGVGADNSSVISASSGVSETSSRASSYVAPVETLTENPTENEDSVSEVSIV